MQDEVLEVNLTRAEAGVVYLLVSQTIEAKVKFRQFNTEVKKQLVSIQENLHKFL